MMDGEQDYGVPDAENPEWTDEELRTARPFAEVFPDIAAKLGNATHIRMEGALAYGLATFCGAKPTETMSLVHYIQSLSYGAAQQGHVARLPSRLCVRCAQGVERAYDLYALRPRSEGQ